ncbi:MAG: DUF3874 domain-containing protein [Bacteroidaceae bacterium]|nr:DUF3874 domain-containing protein [Bacteroidaceae bacterium]
MTTFIQIVNNPETSRTKSDPLSASTTVWKGENPFPEKLSDEEFASLVRMIAEKLQSEYVEQPVQQGSAEKEPVKNAYAHELYSEKNVAKKKETKRVEKEPAANKFAAMLQELSGFLEENYAFRYNLLTGETEFARRWEACENGKLRYLPVGRREMNGICLAAQAAGIACWDRDVARYIQSDRLPTYHPFAGYFEELPEWDGRDRVNELARRVSDNRLWVNGFHRWMLGTTRQWMKAGEGEYEQESRANSLAPILVSTRQGWGKSTFCRMIVPPALRRHYTESYDLAGVKGCEEKLADFGLINLDEFDRLSPKKMPLLKNLMQMGVLNMRKAYQRNTRKLPRIASFIGTSNRRDLLSDRTGSRRFLCVELTHAIDCNTPIEYDQLYAQLKEELMRGERHWLTSQEERDLERNNRNFYRSTPEEEVFFRCFRFASPQEKGAVQLTATEIFTTMQRENRTALRGCTCHAFSRLLPTLGKRLHTMYGNTYCVVKRN